MACNCEDVPVVVDTRLQYIGLSEGILETWKRILECGLKYSAYHSIVGTTPEELTTLIGYLQDMIVERQNEGEELHIHMPAVTNMINQFVNHQICL